MVCRHDKRCDLTREAECGLDSFGAGNANVIGSAGSAHPVRYGTCQALDIGGQRCVVLQVIGCMVAHDVDNR